MKKIHLYDIHRPENCEELTGRLLNPIELVRGNHKIPKEDFKGTEEYLKDYKGKWYIEVIREQEYNNLSLKQESSPFEIAVYFVGPYGYWVIPAKVYLVLEDADDITT